MTQQRFYQRAARHAEQARRYRRNAHTLLAQSENQSAGCLLYEAAKRCINAVANQRGDNPVRTTAKFQALQSIWEPTGGGFDLLSGWRAATHLHNHADQDYLSAEEFADDWELTDAFISVMLEIYDLERAQASSI